MRTIKDVQYDLRLWGNFWAGQEEGQGYSNKSNVQAIKEACEVGCASSSTLHLFSNKADSIHVPKHIESIDNSLENLSVRLPYVSVILTEEQYFILLTRKPFYFGSERLRENCFRLVYFFWNNFYG